MLEALVDRENDVAGAPKRLGQKAGEVGQDARILPLVETRESPLPAE